MENLSQGLTIVAVGVGGVFVNLLLLMFAVQGIGFVFGPKKKKKKNKKKKPEAAKPTGADDKPQSSTNKTEDP